MGMLIVCTVLAICAYALVGLLVGAFTAIFIADMNGDQDVVATVTATLWPITIPFSLLLVLVKLVRIGFFSSGAYWEFVHKMVKG